MQVKFLVTVDTNNIQTCYQQLTALIADLSGPHAPLALEVYNLPNILNDIKEQIQPVKNLLSLIDRSQLLGDDERLELFKVDLTLSKQIINNLINL